MVLNGPLQAVVGPPLGELAAPIEPVALEWHWYDHLPGFSGWVLILAILLVVKENRNRQAWLILIPFLLLSEALWPWIASLFSLNSVGGLHTAVAYQSLIVAWTAIWLLGPWLARLRPVVALSVALGLAATLGVVAQSGLRGYWYFSPPGLVEDLVGSGALVLSFALSGFSCRKRYVAWKFSLWLLFWLAVTVFMGRAAEPVWHYLPWSMWWRAIPSILPGIGITSVCLAGGLYLINLPYLILAARSPLYHDRFFRLLRLPAAPSPAIAQPEN